MFARRLSFLLAAIVLLTAAHVGSAQDFFLKKGDVVVMMGDSITEQRLYSTYVEIWAQTRFPQYNLVFRNVGIGGDTSGGGNGRFKRDVLTHKPTVLTVDFGMNDGGYIWPGKSIDVKDPKTKEVTKKELTAADVDLRLKPYLKGQQGIADQAKAAGIRVAWITPQPVESKPGDVFEKYNGTLERFSAGLGDIAKNSNGLFIDQFHPYWAVVEKARKEGEKGRITGGDAVHPGAPGQAVMAAAIVKGMNLPTDVFYVSTNIDRKMGTFANVNRGCSIDDFALTEGGVKFKFKAEALPFFPEQAKSILKWTPLLEELNICTLKATGLTPGKYDVKFDGKTIASYTDAELAKGVNLAGPALAVGPIADHVKDIVKAINDKTNFYHGQIYSPLILNRNVGPKNPDFKDVAKEDYAKRRDALIAERMEQMPAFDAAIRKALAPRSHLVEVTLTK